MSLLPGNQINQYGINPSNANYTSSGTFTTLYGAARVTNAAASTQLVLPVMLRGDQIGRQDQPMIIPDGAFVVAAVWHIPAPAILPTENAIIARGITGTATDLLKLNTAGFTNQGLTGSTANSLGGVTGAFAASGFLPTSSLETTLGKNINAFDNAASAVAGLGLFTAGSFTAAQRTVNIYSVDTTAIAAGSGVTVSGLPSGYGYSDVAMDIGVQVYIWTAFTAIPARTYTVTPYSLPLP